jgi:hypothetical protein
MENGYTWCTEIGKRQIDRGTEIEKRKLQELM